MKTEMYTELKGKGRNQPVFEGLSVESDLFESLAITRITQSYKNTGKNNIEAVYTFPLPLEAVLLEMNITLGEKTLKGTVITKQEAENQYEEAITDGDTPVMLQMVQPGLYTMNIGNLLPGDTAKITIRYGIFMRWQGNTLRYHLPTTIAPRYGITQAAGLELHQEPITSIKSDNRFRFLMRVHGKLSGMSIDSPTHNIKRNRNTDSAECSLTLTDGTSYMDRDLVVVIESTDAQTSTALITADGNEYLLWSSFRPKINPDNNVPRRSIKIVIDCSGSMAGDSIIQAKEALLNIIEELCPEDWFNIVAFGDNAVKLFDEQVKADAESIAYARRFLRKLDADMGGTELEDALNVAIKIKCPVAIEQNVLLITDGEIWDWEDIVEDVKDLKHRIFTVGVGSSVSEAFVRMLAEETGGACELVSPNENMAERIHTHFKRINTPQSVNNQVVWPALPIRTFPERLETIFDGDTCNIYAWFAEPPTGTVQLELNTKDRKSLKYTQYIQNHNRDIEPSDDVARMVAALKLRTIENDEEGKYLAVSYQLISKWTNYLAIDIRADKADTLPDLQKVEQMLAAGWGGTGSIRCEKPEHREEVFHCLNLGSPRIRRPSHGPKYTRVGLAEASETKESFVSKATKWSRNLFSNDKSEVSQQNEMKWIWEVHTEDLDQMLIILDQLISKGTTPEISLNIPFIFEELAAAIKLIIKEGIEEKNAIAVFLYYLSSSDAGKLMSKQTNRIIVKRYKELSLDESTKLLLKNYLKKPSC